MGAGLSTIGSLYATNPSSFATQTAANDYTKWKEYDYIIVGGGTAGCVLASRLSEDRSITVLLIESGPSQGNILSRAPLAWTKTFKTSIDWDYSISSPHLSDGTNYHLPRGKVLGGTSALNALIYDRCSPEDYDAWANSGCDSWAFKDLEPYFRKAEGYDRNGLLSKISLDDKGTAGPWRIRQTPYLAPIVDSIVEACKTIGMPYVEDMNSPQKDIGVGRLAGVVDERGRRSSVASAYLSPNVLARPNLTISVQANVEKFQFSVQGETPRAVGVQIAASSSGPKYRVATTREIILSAGSISSPHLLFVSGIGPEKELEGAGISLVKDIPGVGKHLLDHITSGPVIFRSKPELTLDYLNHSRLSALSSLIKWLWNGSGPFGRMAIGSVAFARSDDSKIVDTTVGVVKDLTSGPKSPDIELMFSPAVVPNFFHSARPGEYGISIAANALKPESEGSIQFKSGSIWDRPILSGNYFASENDINVLARGVRLIIKLAHSEPLRSQLEFHNDNQDKNNYFWLGDQDPEKLTDDDIREFLKRNSYPCFHIAGTCRMGPDPRTSVVDSNLKVHGVLGLRVVDASIFPSNVSGHPAAPVVAIAEKAADMINTDRRA